MPRPKLPYVHKQTTRHGKTVYYFRHGKGPRIRLPDKYGSREFVAAYRAALAGEAQPSQTKYAANTLGWLFDQYKASSKFKSLAPSTQQMRHNIMARIAANAGGARLADITPKVIRKGREDRSATPEAANNFLKVLKAVYSWALEAGLVETDPTRDVKKISVKTDGFRVWTADEILAYEQRHPVGTMARLALDLLIYTGMRRGDVVHIGPQHVIDGAIEFKTSKTATTVHLPVMEPLRRSIEATATGETTFLLSGHNKPFASPAAFGNWFRDRCEEAGVPGRAHGLRKAAASLAAERGATEVELMAIFGWTSNKVATVYTRAASRKKMGLKGGEKLSRSPE